MELGFVSAILPDLTLEEVFSVGRATGYECVEVMCWPPGKAERRYAGVTHIDVSKLDQGEASRILDNAAAHGMKISSLGYYPNLLSPIAGEASVAADHLRNVIRAARKLSISIVNTFIGSRFFRDGPRVPIGIENCPMLFTADEWPGGKNLAASPAIWRRMFEDIPSEYFGLNARIRPPLRNGDQPASLKGRSGPSEYGSQHIAYISAAYGSMIGLSRDGRFRELRCEAILQPQKALLKEVKADPRNSVSDRDEQTEICE